MIGNVLKATIGLAVIGFILSASLPESGICKGVLGVGILSTVFLLATQRGYNKGLIEREGKDHGSL